MTVMKAEVTLACNECKEPMTRTPKGGFYCLNCLFTPSMQDTFIFYRCPKCKVELKDENGLLRCPHCGTYCLKEN